jgi:sugar phosphate isomerase/epimerase
MIWGNKPFKPRWCRNVKPCLFSVSYAGLWGQESLEVADFLRRAARLGYGAVMLMGKRPHLSPLDISPDKVADLKRVLAETRLECAVLGAYTDFSGAAAAEVPFLEMQIAYVEALARLAGDLGAKVVRVFSAYEQPGVGFAALWDRTVSCLKECCDRAAAYGVTLAVQNHHDLGAHSDVLRELLSDVDRANCKAAFDAWSPALRGEDLYEAARRMAPVMACTTNADYVKLPRFHYQPALVNYAAAAPDAVRAVPFGSGFIDYQAFFTGLKDGGYGGIATYEMCSPLRGGGSLDNLDRCAVRYVAWMKEHALVP